jgi:hypothetical protein
VDPITDYWVEFAELTGRRRLGWGDAGNSEMWMCEYTQRRFVFKEYSDDFRADVDQNALEGLIRWRDHLSADDRRHLDRVAAWPRYRVRHNGVLCGVLLPVAPDEFFRPMYPDGRYRPNVIANLIRRTVADGNVIEGAPVAVKTRAIGYAADVLLWFHRHNVFVNDVRELNILCTEQGSPAYFVDCDVMIGPWGQTGPVAAPQYLMDLLPDPTPSPRVEFARLGWVAVWLLLDDFSRSDAPLAELTKVIDARDAELIVRTVRLHPISVDEWRHLANRWLRWTARAPVSPPSGPSEVITPTPWQPDTYWLPPTRTMPEPQRTQPGRWVPEHYRRPAPVAPTAYPAALVPDPDVPQRRTVPPVLIAASVAVVLLALVGIALLQAGA